MPVAVHPHVILECLISRRFGVEYQPFISTASGEIVCYEALARFFDAQNTPIAPDCVFEALHDNPLLLLHAELEMKRLQLAEAPPNGLLFVNLDPDSFAAGATEDGGNLFLPLFAEQRSRLVIELIENLHLQDVHRSAQMVEALEAAKLRCSAKSGRKRLPPSSVAPAAKLSGSRLTKSRPLGGASASCRRFISSSACSRSSGLSCRASKTQSGAIGVFCA